MWSPSICLCHLQIVSLIWGNRKLRTAIWPYFKQWGTGKVTTQWLRTCIAFADHPIVVPSASSRWLTTACYFTYWWFSTIFWLPTALALTHIFLHTWMHTMNFFSSLGKLNLPLSIKLRKVIKGSSLHIETLMTRILTVSNSRFLISLKASARTASSNHWRASSFLSVPTAILHNASDRATCWL